MEYSTKNYIYDNNENLINTNYYYSLTYKKQNYLNTDLFSYYIQYDSNNQSFYLKAVETESVNEELNRSIYDGKILQLILENKNEDIFRFHVMKSQYYATIHIYLDLCNLKNPIYYNEYIVKALQSYIHKNKTVKFNKHNIPAKNEIIEEKFPELEIELFQYQKNNVVWMNNLEKLTDLGLNKYEYYIKEDNNCQKIKVKNTELYMNKTSGIVFSDIGKLFDTHELKLNGGVLHDEVGLGKTFSCLTHIIRSLGRELKTVDKKKKKDDGDEDDVEYEYEDDLFVSNATLVICPARLCAQWEDELYKLVGKNKDIRIHTISTIVNYKKLMINLNNIVNTDIIFISTNIFNNDNYKRIVYEDSKDCDKYYKLEDIKWKRIIFDEGHEILYDQARTSKLSVRNMYNEIMNLTGKYKWICSGTPLPHGKHSFNSIIKYLSNSEYNCTKNNLEQETVDQIIEKNFRMNTKESVKGQIFIPKINEKTILLTQTPIEKNMYLNASGDNLRMIQLCTNILVSDIDNDILGDDLKSLEDVQTRMINYFEKEINIVEKKIEVFKQEIIDLGVEYDTYDEFPVHSDQWKQGLNNIKSKISYRKEKIKEYKDDIGHLEARKSLFTTLQNRVKEVVTEPCPICYDVIEKVTLTKCSHIFCEDCIMTYIKGKSKVECPMCRTSLDVKKDIGFSIDSVDEDENVVAKNSDEYESNLNKWGTKMAYLIKLLKLIIEKSEDNRIILFSQWGRMLQLVGSVLDENSIKNVYLKGNIHVMSKNIRKFKNDKDIRVIMLSSDTCCSGSNLTEASHIILLDTVNGNKEHAKAVEEQAIGRAARLGQMKNVEVFRLIMKDTIEEQYYNSNVGDRVKFIKKGTDKQLDKMFNLGKNKNTSHSHVVV